MLARFLNNWPYKLAAVLIAIALHRYVNGLMNPDIPRILPGVPLVATNIPSGTVVTSMPQNVTIELSGPANVLNNLRDDDRRISATVNLSGSHTGTNPDRSVSVALSPDISDQVTVDSISPPTVQVAIDQLQQIQMPVRVSFARLAPAGYIYQQPVVAPSLAMVSGAESQLKMVRELVAYADVGNESRVPSTVEGMFDVIALDEHGAEVPDVTVNPTMVHVTIPIARASAAKALVVSPVIVGAPAYPWEVSAVDVQPTMVMVTGPAPDLATTSVATTAPIDIAGATGTVRRQVDLRLAPGLQLPHPATVIVTVRVVRQRTASAAPQASSQLGNAAPPGVH